MVFIKYYLLKKIRLLTLVIIKTLVYQLEIQKTKIFQNLYLML